MATNSKHGSTSQGKALLEWFDSLPSFAYAREGHVKWEDLADGSKIWNILKTLDPQYFHTDLPQAPNRTGRWLDNWENLKHVYKVLANFVKERNGKLPSGYGTIQLKEIAMQADPEELSKASLGIDISSPDFDIDITIQLLKMVLFVATRATNNEAYIGVMVQMTEDRQKDIMRAIVEVGTPPQLEPLAAQFLSSTQSNEPQFEESAHSEREVPDIQNASPPPTTTVDYDKDLLHEQQLVELAAQTDRLTRDKKDLQRDVRDLHDRIDRLQEHNSTLQEELKNAQDRLTHLSITEGGQAVITRLNKRVQEQEDLIAQQETQLRDSHNEIENVRQEIARLHSSDSEVQTLKDEFSIMKTDHDQLTRQLEGKTNTIDKLKQKVQALQNVEKDNEALRLDSERFRVLADDSNKAKGKVLQLEQQLAEYRNVIPTIEQELHESREIRKRKDLEMQQNRMEMDQVREQYNQAQDTITDLIEQARLSSQKRSTDANLDSELRAKAQHEMQVAQTALMMAELTSESTRLDLEDRNQKLQIACDEMTARQTTLEQLLEGMISKNEDLGKRFGDAYKGKLDLENKIREIQRGGKIERSPPPHVHIEPTANSAQSESSIELAREMDMLEAKTTDSSTTIDHGELESLLRLTKKWYADHNQEKRQQSREYQNQIKELQTQLDEQKTMVRTVLGTPADPDDTTISTEELLKAAASGSLDANDTTAATEKHISDLVTALGESRRQVVHRSEVQQNLRYNLLDSVSLSSASSSPTRAPSPSRPRSLLPWSANKKK